MYEIFDDYCWEDHKKVITFEKHQVPGLKNFCYWNLSRAIPPSPLHHHSDIVEIHFVIKGKRYTYINDSVYTITGNELFITFPFEAHSNGNLPQNPCAFYGFQIDLKYKDGLLGLNKEYSNALSDIILNMKERHLKFTPSQTFLLKQAFSLFSMGTTEDIHTGVQYLCCILFNLHNLEPVSEEKNHNIDKYIQMVLDYVEEHFKENLQLKDLASIAGYSLSRFKIKFKEEVGITPADFISLKKIEYAKHQLEHTNIPITDIAFEVGFSSSNYFCSAFKKLSNYTPTEYRKHALENL
jgi:AraC-like DNA-binding protein